MVNNEKEELIKHLLEIPTETQTIEFKELIGSKIVEKTIETIVAMANADGGFIILGVNDPDSTELKSWDRVSGIDNNFRKVNPRLCRGTTKV